MNALGYLQRIGKALMMPIAVLPAAGLLLRFGQPDLLNLPWMAAAGDAVFGNLPLLFAVGVALGLTSEAGVAALAALVAYFVLTKTATTFNEQINMSVLGGILAGVLAGECYNRFRNTRVPQFLGFFGGKRFVPIITALLSLLLGIIFGYIWPPIQAGIDAIGHWIISAGVIGVFVYGLLNRLLIPIGLHHILNSLVWFLFGSFTTPDGKIVTGDLHRFFAGDKSAGAFMAGFFPVMIFGLVGAALAMYQEARPENRKATGGILLSAALTSALTGITEPLEFAFMFVSPVLYGIHAVLMALSMAVCYLLNIRVGFTFSAGLIDYILSFNISTRPLLVLLIGPVFFVLYYLIFRLAIRAWNLTTPGREADE